MPLSTENIHNFVYMTDNYYLLYIQLLILSIVIHEQIMEDDSSHSNGEDIQRS